MINRLKFLLIPLAIFCSVMSLAQNNHIIDSCETFGSTRMVGFDDYNFVHNCQIIKLIANNLEDPHDMLFKLYRMTTGIEIDSLHESERKAWILNFWYGGSCENIFIYKENKAGFYSKLLTLSGAIGFEVQDTLDSGFKRILIKNNRNLGGIVLFYNGADYNSYYHNGVRKILNDSIGVETLEKMEIYVKDIE